MNVQIRKTYSPKSILFLKAYYHLWASFCLTQPLNMYRWNAPTYCKSLLSFPPSWKAYSYYISAAHPATWAYPSCSSLLPVFLLPPSFNHLISMDLLCAQHCHKHFRWESTQHACFIGLTVTERQTTDILSVSWLHYKAFKIMLYQSCLTCLFPIKNYVSCSRH